MFTLFKIATRVITTNNKVNEPFGMLFVSEGFVEHL